jgi:tetratricopeptide (TPR) repeat protein
MEINKAIFYLQQAQKYSLDLETVGNIELAIKYWYLYSTLEPKISHKSKKAKQVIANYCLTINNNVNNKESSDKLKFIRAVVNHSRYNKLDDNFSPAYQEIARFVLNLNDLLLATGICCFLLQYQPQNWYFHLLFAKILTKKNNWQTASHHYQQAINLCQYQKYIITEILLYSQELTAKISDPDIYYNFAQALREKGLYLQAIEHLQQALKIDPTRKFLYIALQYIPIPEEEVDKLIELYLNILQKNKKFSLAWSNLGQILTQKGAIDAAIVCYRQSAYYQAIYSQPHLDKLNWQGRKEKAPDFIIIGATKCGTTSLFNYLNNCSQILLPNKKELNFFNCFFYLGIEWYLPQFASITDEDEFLTGEASPNYFHTPESMWRIKKVFPKIKLIVLLRNPVERTISSYYQQRRSGIAQKPLELLISQEMEYLKKLTSTQVANISDSNAYNILGSLYVYKIQKWIECFSREQILIIKSEDFYNNTSHSMSQVFNFIGIPDCPLEHYPVGNSGSYPPINSKIRNILADYFALYNRKLEEFLGIKFNWD